MSSTPKILFDNNPFYTNAAANPWENQYPDVESINKDAFRGISQISLLKSKNPKDPLAALVLGESGSGKTHLLKRILHSTVHEDPSYLFVNIRPILNPNTPMRHLLKGIIIDLGKSRENEPGYTQLHLIITKILIDLISSRLEKNPDIIQKLKKDPRHFFQKIYNGVSELELLQEEAIRHIHNKSSDINKHFLKVLFQVGDEEKTGLVIDWLKGDSLDEEDCKKLGVPGREGKDDLALEEEAREIIISLGILMQRYEQTALICFDQLDNLKTPELINAFSLMIHTLINDTFAMIPIAFVRGDSWNTNFKHKIDLAVQDRLEMNTYTLTGCSLHEADQIIQLRLRFFLNEKWEEAYQWLSAKLHGTLHEGYSPRQIILLANRVIQKTNGNENEPKSPYEVLAEHYRNECDLVVADFDNWPPDSDQIEFALKKYLENQNNIPDVRKKPKNKINLYATFQKSENDSLTYSFIINTREHFSSVGNCFQRGIEFMENEQGACIYITDPRCIYSKPGWKATNKKMETFLSQGGEIWRPEIGNISRWYGLASLIFKATEGDISVEGNGGLLRPVTENELNTFIGTATWFGKPLFTLHSQVPAQPSPDIDHEKLLGEISVHLSQSPMKSLSIENLQEKLKNDGLRITHDQILEFAGKQKNSFIIYPIKQGSLIMLKGTHET